MPQREIEVILSRQLASYLSTPVFIVDESGTLVFYNEPAEQILGQRFEETGEMPRDEWITASTATDNAGNLLPRESLPLMVALTERRPVHGHFWITGLDKVRRCIATTAFPIVGQAGRNLGAMAIFWEFQE
jgi:PAS domain-containing protein